MPKPANTPTPSPNKAPSPTRTPTPSKSQSVTPSSDDPVNPLVSDADKALQSDDFEDVGDLPEPTKQTPSEDDDSIDVPQDEEESVEPSSDEPSDEPEPEEPTEPEEPEEPTDLAKLDEKLLKQMSRPAREHVTKRLSALANTIAEKDAQVADLAKQLETTEGKRLPEHYYEHPGAYKLSPRYQEVEKAFHTAVQNVGAWNDQLDALETGSDFYVLNQQGEPVLISAAELEEGGKLAGQKPRFKRMMEDARLMAYEEQKKHSAEAEFIAKNFAAQQREGEKAMQTWVSENIPWTKDEKAPEQIAYKKVLSKIAEMRGISVNHLSVDAHGMAALGVVVLQERAKFQQRIKKLEAQLKGEASRRRAGPIPGGGAGARTTRNDGEKKLTLDDFQ